MRNRPCATEPQRPVRESSATGPTFENSARLRLTSKGFACARVSSVGLDRCSALSGGPGFSPLVSTIQPLYLTVCRFPQSVVAFLVPVRLRQYKNIVVSLVSQNADSKRNEGVWTPGSGLSDSILSRWQHRQGQHTARGLSTRKCRGLAQLNDKEEGTPASPMHPSKRAHWGETPLHLPPANKAGYHFQMTAL